MMMSLRKRLRVTDGLILTPMILQDRLLQNRDQADGVYGKPAHGLLLVAPAIQVPVPAIVDHALRRNHSIVSSPRDRE